MTTDKDLKRLVRARMKKTGEAYTAARAQITKATAKPTTKAAPVSRGAAPAVELAKLAGKSDASVSEKTGRDWAGWVAALDGDGAATMAHREIAALVHSKYAVQSWWAQTVVVGYERIKGLRATNQLRDGKFQITKSRTYDVPVAMLFKAWLEPASRRRWLDRAGVKTRTATAHKSMRLDWPGGGIIAVGFLSKGKNKSAVALEHAKLPDRETAENTRRYWAERLDRLAEFLVGN